MKSLIPEYISGFRSAVINRLIDWAQSQTIIVGPGLEMRESESGTRIDLAPVTGKVTYMPFDVMLVYEKAAETNHVLVYMPLGLAGWVRGRNSPIAYDSLSTAATAAWPLSSGQTLPTGSIYATLGWIDTGLTWAPGGDVMDIFAWVSTGGSYDITASPSLLAFNTSSMDAIEIIGLQKHIAQIQPDGSVVQLFEGLIDEIGYSPL